MKLEYWVAVHKEDARCYWIRAKTRREVDIARWKSGVGEMYYEPVKVVVDYKDGFDLLDQCVGEGGLIEESQAQWAAEGSETPEAEG